ncbi:hypothetical protein JR316_0012220 [Psilocybe cubensis]|uniref:Uncharacterized protein n=2 Tax=Psilocybe cubensis TaxID=181762 RepID=A0A8H8CFG6_PSICU|nr:hypothetical protein JR316_0012220 [Psilocybe cubensis]KAH9475109.1 hypothetical protein JR316_0012220 [Psilocybe cubensis]
MSLIACAVLITIISPCTVATIGARVRENATYTRHIITSTATVLPPLNQLAQNQQRYQQVPDFQPLPPRMVAGPVPPPNQYYFQQPGQAQFYPLQQPQQPQQQQQQQQAYQQQQQQPAYQQQQQQQPAYQQQQQQQFYPQPQWQGQRQIHRPRQGPQHPYARPPPPYQQQAGPGPGVDAGYAQYAGNVAAPAVMNPAPDEIQPAAGGQAALGKENEAPWFDDYAEVPVQVACGNPAHNHVQNEQNQNVAAMEEGEIVKKEEEEGGVDLHGPFAEHAHAQVQQNNANTGPIRVPEANPTTYVNGMPYVNLGGYYMPLENPGTV